MKRNETKQNKFSLPLTRNLKIRMDLESRMFTLNKNHSIEKRNIFFINSHRSESSLKKKLRIYNKESSLRES